MSLCVFLAEWSWMLCGRRSGACCPCGTGRILWAVAGRGFRAGCVFGACWSVWRPARRGRASRRSWNGGCGTRRFGRGATGGPQPGCSTSCAQRRRRRSAATRHAATPPRRHAPRRHAPRRHAPRRHHHEHRQTDRLAGPIESHITRLSAQPLSARWVLVVVHLGCGRSGALRRGRCGRWPPSL